MMGAGTRDAGEEGERVKGREIGDVGQSEEPREAGEKQQTEDVEGIRWGRMKGELWCFVALLVGVLAFSASKWFSRFRGSRAFGVLTLSGFSRFRGSALSGVSRFRGSRIFGVYTRAFGVPPKSFKTL